MKKIIFPFLLLVALFFSCSKKETEHVIWLDSQYNISLEDTTAKSIPIYYGELKPEYYSEFLTDSIGGFAYQEGYVYKLLVKKTIKENKVYLKLIKQLLKKRKKETDLDYFVGHFTYKDNIPFFTDCLSGVQLPVQEKSDYYKAQEAYNKLNLQKDSTPIIKFKGEFGFEVNKNGVPIGKVYKIREFEQFESLENCEEPQLLEGSFRCKDVPYLLRIVFNTNYGFSVYIKKANSEFLMRNGFWMRKGSDTILVRMYTFKKRERMEAFAYCKMNLEKGELKVIKSNIVEFQGNVFRKED